MAASSIRAWAFIAGSTATAGTARKSNRAAHRVMSTTSTQLLQGRQAALDAAIDLAGNAVADPSRRYTGQPRARRTRRGGAFKARELPFGKRRVPQALPAGDMGEVAVVELHATQLLIDLGGHVRVDADRIRIRHHGRSKGNAGLQLALNDDGSISGAQVGRDEQRTDSKNTLPQHPEALTPW